MHCGKSIVSSEISMRIRKTVCLVLVGLCIMQFMFIYFETEDLQKWYMTSKIKHQPRKILVGFTSDRSGKYLIHRFYKSEGFGVNSIDPKDITLVSHCTVDRLHHIIGLAESWGGPMSISIFASGEDAAFADDAIDSLRLCWPVLRKLATFHLVYPRHESSRANMTKIGSFTYVACKYFMQRLFLKKSSKDHDRAMKGLQYPHNLMRNVALSGVLNEFVLSVDIEMIPSANLRKGFLTFANTTGLHSKPKMATSKFEENKTIFVLPAFEVKRDLEPRMTKQDIIAALTKSDARPLLQEICPQCHKGTNYEKWSSASNFNQKFGIAYQAQFSTGWEPFFIYRRNSPWFDENMTKVGHDRLSHICELHSQGYKFQVLNNGFLIRNYFRFKNQMTDEENIRKDNKLTFKEKFRNDLQKSGRISNDAIRSC